MVERPVVTRAIGSEIGADEAIELCVAVGWGTAEQYRMGLVRDALDNTMLLVQARTDDGRLVGMARVFGDGHYVSHLSEILVHPEYQRLGVGRAMLDLIKKECQGTTLYVDGLRPNADYFLGSDLEQPTTQLFSRRAYSLA
jgi:ribosomal protein S18 acetylase RimI-like enzyme